MEGSGTNSEEMDDSRVKMHVEFVISDIIRAVEARPGAPQYYQVPEIAQELARIRDMDRTPQGYPAINPPSISRNANCEREK